ncbi:MAG: hypothetical protein JNG88_00200 [Phycisphaerales bacterium]|nr:hypothetical protein [Phycisphaerales bacterium]
MLRAMLGLIIGGGLLATAVGAQSTSTTGAAQVTPLSEQTPQENARSGSVSERAPGRIIDAARARHNALIAERLTARRTGESTNTATTTNTGTTGTTGGSSSSSGGIAGLINSLSSSGGLAGISGLLNGTSGLGGLGGLLGGSTGTTNTTTTTDSSTGGSGGLGDLIRQRVEDAQAANGAAKTNNRAQSVHTTDTAATTAGGAVGRLQKSTQAREQSQTEEDPFRIRLADAVIGTMFDAIAGGMLLPAFVDFLADGMRPVFGLPDPNATNANDNANDNGNTDTNDNTNDNSNDNGSTI